MAKFAQGRFSMKYPDKYIGGKTRTEAVGNLHPVRFCDESPVLSKMGK